MQVGHDLRQRGGDDRLVERGQERGEHDRAEGDQHLALAIRFTPQIRLGALRIRKRLANPVAHILFHALAKHEKAGKQCQTDRHKGRYRESQRNG